MLNYVILTRYEKINPLKMLLYAVNLFFCEYCLSSVFFLGLNRFAVWKAVLLLSTVNLGLLLSVRRKKPGSIELEKSDICFLVLMLLMMPWVAVKGETLRTGSDVGFYFSKAIDLMYGDTLNVKPVAGMGAAAAMLPDSKTALLSAQFFNVEGAGTQAIYTYHSLYTWPSVLALFGTMAGVEHMTDALTVCYILAVGNIWYLLKRCGKDCIAKYVIFPLYAFAPLTLYLAKMTFSEMLFIATLTGAVLLLTDERDEWKIAGAVMAGSLQALHFSALMYLPVIFAMMTYMAVIHKKKIYYVTTQIGLVIYALTFCANFLISPMYSKTQIAHSFGSRFNWKVWVLIMLAVVCVGLVVEELLKREKLIYRPIALLCSWVQNHFAAIFRVLTVLWLAGVVFRAYQLGFTEKYIAGTGSWAGRASYANQQWESLWHTNFYSFFIGLSYIGIPYILYKVIRKKEWSTWNVLFAVPFIYTCFLYTVVRCDTPSNYYGSRYFAIFLIPVAVLLIGSLIENKKEAILIMAVALATSLPYSNFIKDQIGYEGSKDILEDTLEAMESGSAVFLDVDRSGVQILGASLGEIEEDDVWLKDDMEAAAPYYGNTSMYYISNERQEAWEDLEVLHKTYRVSSDISCLDNFQTLVQYPLSRRSATKELYIYKLQ